MAYNIPTIVSFDPQSDKADPIIPYMALQDRQVNQCIKTMEKIGGVLDILHSQELKDLPGETVPMAIHSIAMDVRDRLNGSNESPHRASEAYTDLTQSLVDQRRDLERAHDEAMNRFDWARRRYDKAGHRPLKTRSVTLSIGPGEDTLFDGKNLDLDFIRDKVIELAELHLGSDQYDLVPLHSASSINHQGTGIFMDGEQTKTLSDCFELTMTETGARKNFPKFFDSWNRMVYEMMGRLPNLQLEKRFSNTDADDVEIGRSITEKSGLYFVSSNMVFPADSPVTGDLLNPDGGLSVPFSRQSLLYTMDAHSDRNVAKDLLIDSAERILANPTAQSMISRVEKKYQESHNMAHGSIGPELS